jgi:hypothetical protein
MRPKASLHPPSLAKNHLPGRGIGTEWNHLGGLIWASTRDVEDVSRTWLLRNEAIQTVFIA